MAVTMGRVLNPGGGKGKGRPNDVDAAAFTRAESVNTTAPPEEHGFSPVKPSRPKRLVIMAYGPEKCGKTHFALTGPGPIFIFNFDDGLEVMVNKFIKAGKDAKEILEKRYSVRIGNESDGSRAMRELEEFRKDYIYALANAKTVIIDTGTHLWDLARGAHFDGSKNATQLQYTRPNAEMRWVMAKAREQKTCNVVFIERAGKEYVTDSEGKSNPSGKLEPKGWKDAPFEAQAVVYCNRDPIEAKRAGKGEGFYIQIVSCRARPNLTGTEFHQADGEADFASVACEIIQGSEKKDWQ
jgi:hypothetical protein